MMNSNRVCAAIAGVKQFADITRRLVFRLPAREPPDLCPPEVGTPIVQPPDKAGGCLAEHLLPVGNREIRNYAIDRANGTLVRPITC